MLYVTLELLEKFLTKSQLLKLAKCISYAITLYDESFDKNRREYGIDIPEAVSKSIKKYEFIELGEIGNLFIQECLYSYMNDIQYYIEAVINDSEK